MTDLILVPSPYQQALYDFIKDGEGSAIVEAVAGSGKTTTIIEALKFIPPHETVQLFAFNTAIAAELKARIPSAMRNVRAATFHSVGYRALCRHLGMKAIETNSRKLYQLCRELPDPKKKWLPRVPKEYESFACKLVGLAKGDGLGAVCENDPLFWQDLIDHHGIDYDGDGDPETALRLARQLFARSVEAAEEYMIDFDDQLYLPILWKIPLEQTDWVFVDEAQDTNPIRRALASRVLKPGGRMICVGDRKQSIYGFTGASIDAMDQLKEAWNCTELPLSVCYRCPTTVIEQAQTLVPYIEAAPGAPKGRVEHLQPSEGVKQLTAADAVLCRNNAPLVELAYWCLARGIACQILGRDIGKGLQALVEKLKPAHIDDLITRLDVYRTREMKKYHDKEQHGKAQSVADRVDCLTTLIDNLPEDERTLPGLGEALNRLFGDDVTGRLTLSTVHKAKGKQWPQVAILRPELMPSFWAVLDWEQVQEENVQYVAWTRAQQALIFLDGYGSEYAPSSIDRPLFKPHN